MVSEFAPISQQRIASARKGRRQKSHLYTESPAVRRIWRILPLNL
jgi:hypothetical protein